MADIIFHNVPYKPSGRKIPYYRIYQIENSPRCTKVVGKEILYPSESELPISIRLNRCENAHQKTKDKNELLFLNIVFTPMKIKML